jgi:CDP-diacylglycerol--serine O-phosphatidyltransferase
MDLLDGRIARLMHATSDMGMHLDSLSDAVSFCLAPAFLVFSWRLKAFGFMGILVCSIFFLAGQLRLARFNVLHITQLQSILGLPSTIAGCFVAALMLNVGHVDAPWFLIVLSSVLLALAATMVSIIPFPTFKQKLLGLRVSPQVAVFVALVAIIALLQLNLALLVSFSGYILSALVPAALRRFKRPFQEKL